MDKKCAGCHKIFKTFMLLGVIKSKMRFTNAENIMSKTRLNIVHFNIKLIIFLNCEMLHTLKLILIYSLPK